MVALVSMLVWPPPSAPSPAPRTRENQSQQPSSARLDVWLWLEAATPCTWEGDVTFSEGRKKGLWLLHSAQVVRAPGQWLSLREETFTSKTPASQSAEVLVAAVPSAHLWKSQFPRQLPSLSIHVHLPGFSSILTQGCILIDIRTREKH